MSRSELAPSERRISGSPARPLRTSEIVLWWSTRLECSSARWIAFGLTISGHQRQRELGQNTVLIAAGAHADLLADEVLALLHQHRVRRACLVDERLGAGVLKRGHPGPGSVRVAIVPSAARQRIAAL